MHFSLSKTSPVYCSVPQKDPHGGAGPWKARTFLLLLDQSALLWIWQRLSVSYVPSVALFCCQTQTSITNKGSDPQPFTAAFFVLPSLHRWTQDFNTGPDWSSSLDSSNLSEDNLKQAKRQQQSYKKWAEGRVHVFPASHLFAWKQIANPQQHIMHLLRCFLCLPTPIMMTLRQTCWSPTNLPDCELAIRYSRIDGSSIARCDLVNSGCFSFPPYLLLFQSSI